MTILVEKRQCRRRAEKGEPTFIYFIGEETLEHVKIGVARCPDERLGTLQIGNPRTLRFWAVTLGSREDESMLHHYFDGVHLQGEWFTVDARLRLVMHLAGGDMPRPAGADSEEPDLRRLFGHMFGCDHHAMSVLRMARRVEARMGPV